jgi:hypothetical protein
VVKLATLGTQLPVLPLLLVTLPLVLLNELELLAVPLAELLAD